MRLSSKLFLLLTLLLSQFANGQITLSGQVYDENHNPIKDVYVLLLNATDSSMVNYTLTNALGEYWFKNQFHMKYLIQTSHTSFEPQYVFVPSYNVESYKLNTIILKERNKVLEEVNIINDSPMRMNGDTIEFNSKFIQPTDRTTTLESLLKSLPGFSVNSNGDISFNNKSIQVLTIEGKRFFSDDPRMATRNIPMNAVAKVQVFNSKTRESEISGLDDGKRENRVNVKLKKEYKNSWFGKFDGGIGNPKYRVSTGINKFNERHQLGAIVSSNNLNVRGLSQQQYKDFTGRNTAESSDIALYNMITLPSLFYSDLLNHNATYIPEETGQSKSTAIGVNYNYQYLKTRIYTTAYYNNQQNLLTNSQAIQNFLGDFKFSTDSRSNTISSEKSYQFSSRIEHNFSNTDKLFIDFNTRKLSNKQDIASATISQSSEVLIENSAQHYRNKSVNENTATAIYSHQFKKPSRAISMSQTVVLNRNNDFSKLLNILPTDTTDRIIYSNNTPNTSQTGFSWMEPVGKHLKLQPFYNLITIRDTPIRLRSDHLLGSYQPIDTLSYQFDYTLRYHRAGSSFHLKAGENEKLSLKTTLARQFLLQHAKHQNNYVNHKQLNDWITDVSLEWNHNKLITLVNYYYKIEPVEANQLIPIVTNDQPLQIQTTNPALKKEKINSFFWSSYYLIKGFDRRLEASINYTKYGSRNIETRYVTDELINYTQLESLTGSKATYISVKYFDVIKLNEEPDISLSKPKFSIEYFLRNGSNPSILNRQYSITNVTEQGGVLSFAWQIAKNVHIGNTYQFSRQHFKNEKSFSNNLVNKHLLQIISKVSITPSLHFTCNTSYRKQINKTYNSNQAEPIIDVILSKRITKHEGLYVNLSGFDLLNRRIGLRYSSQAIGTVAESYSNTINRYFLISVSYHFKK